MNNSQDSKVTLAQDFLVTRKTCRQIFMSFGHTRKCYPLNQDSLLVGTEMLQYIHKGHQGKERCLLRARNTVFWPKMIYNVQQIIEKCIICQEYGKSQPMIATTQKLPPFPWHTLVTDMFYWKRMDFLIVVDVFPKYIIVRKLPNSTSAAVCIELSMIVTELGLPHIIISDNGPCYNSKVFQQFLQCYSITHQTSSPNHPKSNGFVERMVGVAKKLMDRAGKEGKPWILGVRYCDRFHHS